uniref:PAS domain-containing protein n=2 Tax=Chrysotila carterae TaxID=13221 RepID=A0A7S4EY36_CHRCT
MANAQPVGQVCRATAAAPSSQSIVRLLQSRPSVYAILVAVGGFVAIALATFLLRLKRARNASKFGISTHPPPTVLAQPISAVRFTLDATQHFYAFVFDYSGKCVAHGGHWEHVGLTLAQVYRESCIDAENLHERFKRTAENGGGWCCYPWRLRKQDRLQVKGAYVMKVVICGRPMYACVSYALRPPPSAADKLGLYAFLCNADGSFAAHGASPSFAGRTMAEVMEATDNGEHYDQSLFQRMSAAVRLGGGWVDYHWRNTVDGPLRQKGAYVVRLQRQIAQSANARATHKDNAGDSNGKDNEGFNNDTNGKGGVVPTGGSVTEGHKSMDTETRAEGRAIGSGATTEEAGGTERGVKAGQNGGKKERAFGTAAARLEGGSVRTDGAQPEVRTQFAGVGFFGGFEAEQGDDAVDSGNGETMARWPAAAKAAALTLKRELLDASDDAEAEEIVNDGSGVLAATTAEALCLEDAQLPPSVAALLQPHATAAALGIYGCVLDAHGRYLAHGGSEAFVGRTIAEVVATQTNGAVDPKCMLNRFIDAAEAGGGWVSYTWRNAPTAPLHIKGAYVTRLAHAGPLRRCYAAFCYGAETAQPLQPNGLPTPPAVAPSRAGVRASALLLQKQLERLAKDLSAQAKSSEADVSAALAPVVADASGANMQPYA